MFRLMQLAQAGRTRSHLIFFARQGRQEMVGLLHVRFLGGWSWSPLAAWDELSSSCADECDIISLKFGMSEQSLQVRRPGEISRGSRRRDATRQQSSNLCDTNKLIVVLLLLRSRNRHSASPTDTVATAITILELQAYCS